MQDTHTAFHGPQILHCLNWNEPHWKETVPLSLLRSYHHETTCLHMNLKHTKKNHITKQSYYIYVYTRGHTIITYMCTPEVTLLLHICVHQRSHYYYIYVYTRGHTIITYMCTPEVTLLLHICVHQRSHYYYIYVYTRGHTIITYMCTPEVTLLLHICVHQRSHYAQDLVYRLNMQAHKHCYNSFDKAQHVKAYNLKKK